MRPPAARAAMDSRGTVSLPSHYMRERGSEGSALKTHVM
jgi:hypothetical protein